VWQGEKVLVPAFSVGRTQQLLYYMAELIREQNVPDFPIYLDSPMAIRAVEVYQRHQDLFDAELTQNAQIRRAQTTAAVQGESGGGVLGHHTRRFGASSEERQRDGDGHDELLLSHRIDLFPINNRWGMGPRSILSGLNAWPDVLSIYDSIHLLDAPRP